MKRSVISHLLMGVVCAGVVMPVMAQPAAEPAPATPAAVSAAPAAAAPAPAVAVPANAEAVVAAPAPADVSTTTVVSEAQTLVADVKPAAPMLVVAGFKMPQNTSLSEIVLSEIWDSLSRSKRFRMPDRGDSAKTIVDMQIANPALVEKASAIAIGKKLNADYVLYGEVVRMDREILTLAGDNNTKRYLTRAYLTVDWSVVQVSSGNVILNQRIIRTNEKGGSYIDASALYQRCALVASDIYVRALQEAMPIKATVLKVTVGKNGTVLVDIGSRQGVTDDYDFNLFTFEPVALPDGRMINKQVDLFLLRPVTIQPNLSELRAGRYSRAALGLGWKWDDKLTEKAQVGYYVETKLRVKEGLLK